VTRSDRGPGATFGISARVSRRRAARGLNEAMRVLFEAVRCSPAANSFPLAPGANTQLARTHRVDSNSRPINLGNPSYGPPA
jgi:hypothetical protein